MFWNKKKQPTEAERLTEEAVELACERFATGGLRGSDSNNWTDTSSVEGRTIVYSPSSYYPALCISGRVFELTKEQAERINNVITRRVLDARRKGD